MVVNTQDGSLLVTGFVVNREGVLRYDGPLDLDLVEGWLDAGARFVGGCCGTGPTDIAELAERISEVSSRDGSRSSPG